jgi:hypothetical protein
MFVQRNLFCVCLLLLAVCLPFPAAAQSLARTDRGYVWRHGKEYVRFDRGKWSAGIEGKTEFSWHMFFWHDDWIYETLPGGSIETSPVLTDDGSLAMQGTFSAREDSPPIKYALRLTTADEGLRLAVRGLSDGPHNVEWWDTWQGEPIRTEQIDVRDGLLHLMVPTLKTDTAIKIRAR